MKKEELLDLLMHNKNIPVKLRRRNILKWASLFLILVMGALYFVLMLKLLVLEVFLQGSKKNGLEPFFIIGLFIPILILILSDSYNPLTKIKGFNNQLFVLIELIISEIENKTRFGFNLKELILLFKKYLYNMSGHAQSLYIFENKDISSVTSKLSNIPYSKFRSLIDHDQELILALLKSLNNQYVNKMNERSVLKQEYDLLLKNINQIGNYEPGERDKVKWISKMLEYFKKKKSGIIILLIVILATNGILLDLLGASDEKYYKYFTYISGVVSIVFAAFSSKLKE